MAKLDTHRPQERPCEDSVCATTNKVFSYMPATTVSALIARRLSDFFLRSGRLPLQDTSTALEKCRFEATFLG